MIICCYCLEEQSPLSSCSFLLRLSLHSLLLPAEGLPFLILVYHTMVLYFLNSVFPVQVLHLVEQLCLALNDEFRMYLLHILPSCIQVLGDAKRCNDYCYVPDILHTLEVFGGVSLFPT